MPMFGLFLAVLCSERVSRITKTYHDIDAVTNLLDEVCRAVPLAHFPLQVRASGSWCLGFSNLVGGSWFGAGVLPGCKGRLGG